MHTVELLEQALELARELGYGIRQEWLDGNGGGVCLLRGEPWIFVDLAESHREQLELVLEAIASSDRVATIQIPPVIDTLLRKRAA